MRLSDVLIKDLVMSNLEGAGKREVLGEMCSSVAAKVDGVSSEELLEVLLTRERLGSTGIGHGVALPHGKLKSVDSIVVALGRSEKGVDFESMDSRPVHLFFLIVAPENSAVSHLKLLANISRLLKEKSFRKKLLKASGRDELYGIIMEEDAKGKARAVGQDGN